MEPNLEPNKTTDKENRKLSNAEEILGSLPRDFSDFRRQIDASDHSDAELEHSDTDEHPKKEPDYSIAQAIAIMRGEEWTPRYEEYPEAPGTSTEAHDEASRYNHMLVSVEEVIRQPEEYIIPECLPTCKYLWDKNIDTVQCSNYEDKTLYVELGSLSNENKAILQELINHNTAGYSVGFNLVGDREDIRIKANTPEELYELAQVFNMQDVQEGEGFTSAENFLEEFRTIPKEVDEYGNVFNGLLDGQGDLDATLEQALIAKGMEHLYVPDEGRVYMSDFYLQKHNNYLESKNQ